MLSFFPLDILDEIWDVIESVFEEFLTYSLMAVVSQMCAVISLQIRGIKIKGHMCFNMKYGHHPSQIICRSLTTYIDGDFFLNGKILLHVVFFVGCVDGVQCACVLMVNILQTETFVTLDFDPSNISRQFSYSDLDQIKLIFGHNLVGKWSI